MRPRKCRLVRSNPTARFFKPRGAPLSEIEIIKIKDEEYEAILLADYKGMEQEKAAIMMGISRPTFSRILSSARKAIAKALAEGSALEIGGGDFTRIENTRPHTKGNTMKIAFTTSGNDLSAPMDLRFGRAAKFLIFDTTTQETTIIDNTHSAAAQGAGIKAAETIVNTGATILITGDCGPKAFNALQQANVKIYSAKSMSVNDALEAFLAEKLSEITSA